MDNQIEYHLQKIKAIQSHLKDTGKGKLKAEVFLRQTGAIRNNDGNYVINPQDIIAYFEHGNHLSENTEWDKF